LIPPGSSTRGRQFITGRQILRRSTRGGFLPQKPGHERPTLRDAESVRVALLGARAAVVEEAKDLTAWAKTGQPCGTVAAGRL